MKMNFLCNTYSVKKIMFFVLIALIPAFLIECYFYGVVILIQILLFIIFSLLFEIIILKLRNKNIKHNILDNSSILTSVLMGLSIPSTLTWWMIVFGAFFSIVIAKHLYGGLGHNIFNPAMVGYTALLISFPLYMSAWHRENINIFSLNDLKVSVNKVFFQTNINDVAIQNNLESFTGATPLNDMKNKSHLSYESTFQNIIIENKKIFNFSSYNCINLSFLLGGFFLLYKKIICWRIPLSFLCSLFLFFTISYLFTKNPIFYPFFHLFFGGTMICAFFIATDPVTTSCSNIGKIIFGLIIGLLVYIIRSYSDYPDGVSFSILFGNMLIPLIDNFFKTSGYGHKNI